METKKKFKIFTICAIILMIQIAIMVSPKSSDNNEDSAEYNNEAKTELTAFFSSK